MQKMSTSPSVLKQSRALNTRREAEIHEVSLGSSFGKHGGQGAPAANQTRQQTGRKQRERLG